MAGLRDRPLIRDALLAGGVIAGSCIAVLIAVDRGQAPRPHLVSLVSAPIHSDGDDSTSRLVKSGAATKLRRASPAAGAASQQIGSARPSPKKKSSDMTVVVMVPDLPARENPEAPPPGVWSDQGSAAPVTGANSQAAGLIAMSSVGGASMPLTSPTGGSSAGFPGTSGGASNPSVVSNPAGGNPSARQPDAEPSHSGFVLLAGGQGNEQFALSRAELFDPATNAFAAASPMKDARADHTATVLPGGKILVAGGVGPSGGSLSSAELYDPVSGTFSAAASKMNTARAGHTATLISGCNCPADGKVLIAGGTTAAHGSTLRSAELYDPATGEFIATGAMKATRARHSATLLASGPLAGNVLIAGGTSDENGGDVATAELYDPVTGQFTSTGRMSTPRETHSATWLSPGVVAGALAGSVLIAGGGDVSAPSDSAEVFNPETATFSPVGAMTTARTLQAAVLLANGRVLIAGGQGSAAEFLLSAELFDPAHATFSATGPMHNIHAGATVTVLENGDALIAGGRSNWADLYNTAAGTFSPTGRMVTDVTESTSTLIR